MVKDSTTKPRKENSRQRRRRAFVERRISRDPSFLRESRNLGEVCEYLTFRNLPFRLEGVEIKKSQRWISGPQIMSDFQVPYIDRWGRISGSSFATVRCAPQQYIATIVATVARRFKQLAMRKNGHSTVVRNKDLLIKAAYYYAVSKNDWYRGRVVELLKSIEKNRKIIYGLTTKFLAKIDDYTRFVYSQVCFQTNWLLSRALVPRDKSIMKTRSPIFRLHGLKEEREQWRAIRSVSVRISSMSPCHFRHVLKGE